MGKRAVKILIFGISLIAISSIFGLINSYNKIQTTKADITVSCETLKGDVTGLKTALQGVEDANENGASATQKLSVSNSIQNYNEQCSGVTGAL